MALTSIEQVIAELDSIVRECISENSRSGYFAALYHQVTCRVRDGIKSQEFEDCIRMERMDVLFAIRYIDAYRAWKTGAEVTESWKVAFEAAEDSSLIVTQHLLLGMNAHINLDLGIAAVETMNGESLDNVKQDYLYINQVLASMIAEVQRRMNRVFPLLRLLQLHRTNADDMLINFSIRTARDGAWIFARSLLDPGQESRIRERDAIIAKLGWSIRKPSNSLRFITNIIRWLSFRSPRATTRLLHGIAREAKNTLPAFKSLKTEVDED